ncbi:hypothetical protein H5410_025867 [Solanum commersonii]|uniref:Cytochrome P450 n=1 Tax=Solanum commersonii TaxID=4109 RepID=A0A9J5YX89_SOLCO|nr:hypothetical protein H5410_025867 [Solanum commersonii]
MVKSFSGIRQDELSSLISSIRSTRGGATVLINMSEKDFQSAFGKICKGKNEFITLMKEVLFFAGGFDVADLFPSWKLLHNISGVKSRLMNAHQKVDAIMENIINEHIENKAIGKRRNGEFGDEDLVDVLLRIKENSQLQFPITNDHIKAVISDIFIAGTDQTSSSTIIWVLSEMMRNPNVMAKAQSEVRQVFKGKKKECRKNTNIDGCIIPQKTRVLVNVWALVRDSKYWQNPTSFIPERFENSSIDFMENDFEFIPFGSGRRMCPGIQFALANVGFSLAQLLYQFEWELQMELIQKIWT